MGSTYTYIYIHTIYIHVHRESIGCWVLKHEIFISLFMLPYPSLSTTLLTLSTTLLTLSTTPLTLSAPQFLHYLLPDALEIFSIQLMKILFSPFYFQNSSRSEAIRRLRRSKGLTREETRFIIILYVLFHYFLKIIKIKNNHC